MMRWIYLSTLFLLSFYNASAQPYNSTKLKLAEDSLKGYATKIVFATTLPERYAADSIFTRRFVQALKEKNSFYYPFDSLRSISRLYAADSSFRIITWQMVVNDNLVRQHGAIQMKTDDGSLKLFPLIDKSDVVKNNRDTVADNFNWIGAVYYKIISTAYQNKKYYTLIGFDDNNIRTDKRLIDVLTFPNGKPVFGSKIFSIEKTAEYDKNPARFIMEFKKGAVPRLTFDKELNMIIKEHLVSETGESNKKWTLVPDGDYEGFKWINGRWVYESKIFKEFTPEGQTPIPVPVTDEDPGIPVPVDE